MTIDVSKLIAAPMLQDFLIGKDGLPLADGVVTFYQDSNNTILKNIYYQIGVPGNYSYIALPNPLTLSAAGTIQDVNGNDVIPFYYPWSETNSDIPQSYFVTVYNSLGQLQFTRSNFPFLPPSTTPTVTTTPTLENYLINNRFWRNIGTLNSETLSQSWTYQYNNSGTRYYATLAPDQHDGFSMPDFNYIKNVNGSSTETISFLTFPEQSAPLLVGDVQPEFYINHNCEVDSSGANFKVYQFPVSLHLATLAAQPFTFTIQGQSLSGTAQVSIYIYAFCGSGVPSPAPELMGNITLTTQWQKWPLTWTFPATTGLTLSATGDDAYYLQILVPNANTPGGPVCNLNFALPSIYLSVPASVPTNSFSTYDQIDSVVALPRTGDVKTSLNDFYPYGWAPMNNGTLVNSGTVTPPSLAALAYQGSQGWPLYNLLWNKFNGFTVSGGTSFIPIYTSGGIVTTYGANAYSDWDALKQLKLTPTLGQVMLGSVPMSAMPLYYTSTFTGSATTITPANSVFAFNGMPIYFTGTTALIAKQIYYIGNYTGSTFQVFTSFLNAITLTSAQTVDATGTFVLALNATNEGQYAHTQLVAELATHTHTYTHTVTNILAPATGASGPITTTTDNTGPAGNNAPFNVTQPGTFYNLFVKL